MLFCINVKKNIYICCDVKYICMCVFVLFAMSVSRLLVVAKGVVSAYSLVVSASAAPAGGARSTSVMLRV